MHTPATPAGVAHDHKTFLQVEAYLSYSLDINTQLLESTRQRLTSLETQLATPAAASGKLRKTLKNTRSRAVKKLRQCQSEAETLTRALDEVKAQIAGIENTLAAQRRLSVVAIPGGGSYASSPLDGMSERSSSISSYISSGELSSGAALAYAHGSAYIVSPLATNAGQLPYIHTNLPVGISTHNLPSAPLYPVTPYLASPYAYPYSAIQQVVPEPWSSVNTYHPHAAWNPYQYPENFNEYTLAAEPTNELFPPAPLAMPTETLTWSFQQSPTSDTQTAIPATSKATRRYSIAATPPPFSDTAATRGSKSHRRGVSCNIEELVRTWDAGTT